MNRCAAAVIPVFPAQEIRAAASAGDWARAADLVAGHDQAVRAAFVDPLDTAAREGWVVVMREQQALLLELTHERDRAAAAMRQVERDRRSAHLYLSQQALDQAGDGGA